MFYINNYLSQEYEDKLYNANFKYVIIGKEVGSEGTPHLQGYGELHKQMRLKRIKTEINDCMHIERRRSSQKQAVEYCKKDNEYLEEGSRRVQGERTDLSKLRTDVLNGSKMTNILLENELNSGDICVVQIFYTYLEPERNSKPKVYWYYGPTGSGK